MNKKKLKCNFFIYKNKYAASTIDQENLVVTHVLVMMKGMRLKGIGIQNTFIKKYARKESMIKTKKKKRKILVVKGQLGIRKSF